MAGTLAVPKSLRAANCHNCHPAGGAPGFTEESKREKSARAHETELKWRWPLHDELGDAAGVATLFRELRLGVDAPVVDLEEPVHAPLRAPRVLHDPVELP